MSPVAVSIADPVIVLSSSADMKSGQTETSEVVVGVGEVNIVDAVTNTSTTGEMHSSTKTRRTNLKRAVTLPRMLLMNKKRPKNQRDSANESLNQSRLSGNRKITWNPFIQFVKGVIQKVTKVDNHKMTNRDGLSSSSEDLRVPPTRPAHIPLDRVPGVIGLRNHGNTCFMNAVLQCLSHTDVLAEYFVLDQYKDDLSKKAKVNSKKYGTKGEITEHLALLLKAIWSCQYDPEMSTAFKSVVDKYGSQYRGNLQHDAQEFLLWLLDKVHEDLNQASSKKYKIIKNSFGRPDVVAAKTINNYKRCNESKVHEVFQAQFCSSLTCPICKRQSNTFDPFVCVSVPVAQAQRQTSLFVNVLYTSQQPRQVRIGVSVNPNDSVRELRKKLASDTEIDENHMLLTEVHDEGFHRTFSDCQPLSVITENDPLYCIELPKLKEPTEQAYILLVWINVLVKGDLRERFGSPYTMQVSRETSYEDLQKLLLKEMHTSLADEVLTSSQNPGLFNIRVADPAATPIQDEHPCIDPCVEHPLYTEQIEQALALCADDSGPQHVKLILEWDEATKGMIIQDDTDQIEELLSVKELKSNMESGATVTLEECFDLYTREEILGVEDAWHCPHCNRKQEVVKKLSLWTLPAVLVIHLKRFRQQSKQTSTSKLTMMVDFPLYGFDMSSHLTKTIDQAPPATLKTSGGLRFPHWKKNNRQELNIPKCSQEDSVYDLYAICNHHGQDLQGGHYTAFCRNPCDSQWYCFDDTRVEAISETELMTNSAYILFYQKRGRGSSTATSSAASTSSAGSGFDHWVSRMPPFDTKKNNSTSPNSAPDSDNGNIENNKQSHSDEALHQEQVEEKNLNNFNRGARNYSTLQPTKRNTISSMEDEEVSMRNSGESKNDIRPVTWVDKYIEGSPKTLKKTSSITLTPYVAPTIIQNGVSDDQDTAIIHESTL